MAIDGLVDAETAARILGVSVRRVNQLADAGDISKAARGLYERLSIERHLAERRGTSERAWESTTAWAAIAILSGLSLRPEWLNERSTYRLEATLRTITVAELVGKARGRATVHSYNGHSSVARTIRGTVVARDWSVLGLGGDMDETVDGYIATADLQSLVDRYALVLAPSGGITLRATDFDMATVGALAQGSDVLVALDAAGAVDARTRGTGERALERALASFREHHGRGRVT